MEASLVSNADARAGDGAVVSTWPTRGGSTARDHRATGEARFSALGRGLAELPESSWLLADAVLVALGLMLGYAVLGAVHAGFAEEHIGTWQAHAIFIGSFLTAGLIFGLYERETVWSRARIFTRMLLTSTVAVTLAYAIIYAILYSVMSRRVAACAVGTYLLTGTGLRLTTWWLVHRSRRGLLIVGPPHVYEAFRNAQNEGALSDYRLVGCLEPPVFHSRDAATQPTHEVDPYRTTRPGEPVEPADSGGPAEPNQALDPVAQNRADVFALDVGATPSGIARGGSIANDDPHPMQQSLTAGIGERTATGAGMSDVRLDATPGGVSPTTRRIDRRSGHVRRQARAGIRAKTTACGVADVATRTPSQGRPINARLGAELNAPRGAGHTAPMGTTAGHASSATAECRWEDDRTTDPALARILRMSKEQRATDLVVGSEAARDPRAMDWIVPCLEAGLRVTDESTFYEKSTGQVPAHRITPEWFLLADLKLTDTDSISPKRIIDLTVALFGLVLSIPLAVLMTILIYLDDGGPALYSQKRVGQGGRVFRLYKFRTMRVDAEPDGSVWASPNDPRVTRVGRILRKSRLDELPQLYNILLGQMSFVGPRPERPDIVEKLCGLLPHYRERHLIKPGLTGWAQISYKYGSSLEDARRKLQFDLYYLKNRSLELDAMILLRTLGTFLRGGC